MGRKFPHLSSTRSSSLPSVSQPKYISLATPVNDRQLQLKSTKKSINRLGQSEGDFKISFYQNIDCSEGDPVWMEKLEGDCILFNTTKDFIGTCSVGMFSIFKMFEGLKF